MALIESQQIAINMFAFPYRGILSLKAHRSELLRSKVVVQTLCDFQQPIQGLRKQEVETLSSNKRTQ